MTAVRGTGRHACIRTGEEGSILRRQEGAGAWRRLAREAAAAVGRLCDISRNPTRRGQSSPLPSSPYRPWSSAKTRYQQQQQQLGDDVGGECGPITSSQLQARHADNPGAQVPIRRPAAAQHLLTSQVGGGREHWQAAPRWGRHWAAGWVAAACAALGTPQAPRADGWACRLGSSSFLGWYSLLLHDAVLPSLRRNGVQRSIVRYLLVPLLLLPTARPQRPRPPARPWRLQVKPTRGRAPCAPPVPVGALGAGGGGGGCTWAVTTRADGRAGGRAGPTCGAAGPVGTTCGPRHVSGGQRCSP